MKKAMTVGGWASLAFLVMISVPKVRAAYMVLHSFGGSDGAYPTGSLILSGSTLYGTADMGGSSNLGTIFRINADGSGFGVLGSVGFDRIAPLGSLLLSGSTLYGTTGGAASGAGTIFKISTDGSGLAVVCTFGMPWPAPTGSLVLSGSTLYGMTHGDGFNDNGTVFRVTTGGSSLSPLHRFNGMDGAAPRGGLLRLVSTLYGMTSNGGIAGAGTIFKMSTSGGSSFSLLHQFTGGSGDGAVPLGSLVLSGSVLYGMTSAGGSNDLGTIFKINPDGTGFGLLHTFIGGGDGASPFGSLVVSGSTLYGMTSAGGSNDLGTVFQINTDGTGYSIVHHFTGGSADGAMPQGSLVLAPGPALFGMTSAGGSSDMGVIFSFIPSLSAPPTLTIITPARNASISSLPSVVVVFSAPVTGVTAGNLTVNGSPATSVTGSGMGPYTFSGFASPAGGTVNVALAAGSISDGYGTPFAGDSWTYTLTSAPTVATVSPARSASVVVLPSVAVTFSTSVTGVAAGNLTVNGSAAASITGTGAGPYTFSGFATPALGMVNVTLAAGAIQDGAGNAFAGDNWTYSLNPPPTIISISPNSGMNTGPVSITGLAGTNFQAGATVKLTRSGQTDIAATGVSVDNATAIRCTFNLSGVAAGSWDVVVTNPDNGVGTLSSGFTISRAPYVVYVTSTGNDNNTGLSWALAKKTVAAGLTAAASGDQVWVMAGTFYERITLKAGVALYGGFAGTETDLAQRNFRTNPAILDGQGVNSPVVTSPSGATATTRIDGFSIRHGYLYYSSGGGVYCYASSPTITNCTISDNYASEGGGIYCNASSPIIENCTISGNAADYNGGGIVCENSSSPTIENNTIAENIAVYTGGGIYCKSSSATILNNTIRGNSVYDNGNWTFGGGIYCDSGSSIIRNNTISGNSSFNLGGGIHCNSGSPAIVNNTISGNTAFNNGGGISCKDVSSPAIASNIIAFNSSGIYKASGSGVPVLRNNCLFNPEGADYTNLAAGVGDVSADPLLEAPAFGRYHLQPGSPCIDRGNDADVVADQVDLDNQTRTTGSHVDIGADEYDGTVYAFTPAVIRVSPSGNDNNTGGSWAQAKGTVQAGMAAATAAGGGEVWVAEGTYKERITLQTFDYLYGGFAGTETQRDQRDVTIHATILDGQYGGTVVSATARGHRLGRIDGFKIRNGRAYSAGGIYCSGSTTAVISNCTISGNAAYDSTYYSYEDGGGIYCYYAFPTIDHCTISSNSAQDGAGIYCYYSSPTVKNCTISGNYNAAYSYGGGIYCEFSSPTIDGCVISGHTVSGSYEGYGGGIYCKSYSSPVIRNCTIRGNNARCGGGICSVYSSSPTIVNSTISGNGATANGGGVYCEDSSVTLSNNIIAFNGTGIFNSYGTAVLRNNCVFNPTYNYSGLSAGAGDINLDPLFTDQANGNFHLAPASPCINAGNDADVQAGWMDMDGQPRLAGSHVDMGVDEYYPLGDCNLDGYVTGTDLAIVTGSLDKTVGDPDCDGRANVDGDREITSSDLAIVLANLE